MNHPMLMGVAASTWVPPAACTVSYPGTGDGMFEVNFQISLAKDTLEYIDYDGLVDWTLTAGGTRYSYYDGVYGSLYFIPEEAPFSPDTWAFVATTYIDPGPYTGWLPDVWDDYKSSSASTPPTGAWNNWMHITTESDRAIVTGHATGGVNTTYIPYFVDGTRLKYTDVSFTYYMVWLSSYWYICTDTGDVVATALAKKSSVSITPPAGTWDLP